MKRINTNFSTAKGRSTVRGFSLVEMITVLGVMAVLVGLTIPAISGFSSSYNRKSAVDLVMSTIEQARVAALQSGENVYVIMALATDSGASPDAIIVVGDPPIGSTSTAEVLYTHWVKLPLNERFRNSTGTLVANVLTPPASWSLPPLNGNPTYASFTFNSTGVIAAPTAGTGPNGGFDLALYEGVRSKKKETAQGPSAAATLGLSDSGLYEVIRLSQYTGRSWMDISNLLQK